MLVAHEIHADDADADEADADEADADEADVHCHLRSATVSWNWAGNNSSLAATGLLQWAFGWPLLNWFEGKSGQSVLTVPTNSVKLHCVPNRSKDLAVNSHLLFTHIVNKLITRLHADSRKLKWLTLLLAYTAQQAVMF